MPPEEVEFVEIFLDLARPAPGPGFHKAEDELFHSERGFPFVEGGPDFSPFRRQSSEATDVAVFWDPLAAIRRIDVADEPQEPHQREERVASDPPGTKRAVKLEAGILVKDGFRSRRHAKLNVAVGRSDSDERIKKRVRAGDVPARPMFLDQQGFRKARVEMSLRAPDLDPGRVPHDPAHTAMLFALQRIAVLRKPPFQVFRFSDINEFVLLVVNEVNAGRAGK